MLYKQLNSPMKHWCGILDRLAFLPVQHVPAGMAWVKQNAPEELADLMAYFDSTYVSNSFRRIQTPPEADGAVLSMRGFVCEGLCP